MKKLLLVLLTVILVSCTKSLDEGKINSHYSSGLKDEPIKSQVFNISCNGACSDIQNSTCSLVVGNDGSNYVECSCDDCNMVVATTDEQKSEISIANISSLGKIDLFIDNLNLYVAKKFADPNYHITNMEYGFGNNSYYIVYDFITTIGEIGSVMYTEISNTKYEIECNGSCPEQSCRERFYFDPPRAECACESDDCKMTVTQIE